MENLAPGKTMHTRFSLVIIRAGGLPFLFSSVFFFKKKLKRPCALCLLGKNLLLLHTGF